MTKVKICGLTTREDAQVAVEAGAWAAVLVPIVLVFRNLQFIAREAADLTLADMMKVTLLFVAPALGLDLRGVVGVVKEAPPPARSTPPTMPSNSSCPARNAAFSVRSTVFSAASCPSGARPGTTTPSPDPQQKINSTRRRSRHNSPTSHNGTQLNRYKWYITPVLKVERLRSAHERDSGCC